VDFAQVKYGDEVSGEGRLFGDPNAVFMSNPIFSTVREGQSSTRLPDVSTVKIGGESEGKYNPDYRMRKDELYIYKDECLKADHLACNDVMVSRKALPTEIYGYPEALFPPTAFHTATYVPALKAILIIGNESSSDADNALVFHRGITPVYLLEVGTWKMKKVKTGGDGPGIIWNH
jgi:hypothetical protein